MAEWLRSGLQSRVHRFDSGWRLYWVCAHSPQGGEHAFGFGTFEEAEASDRAGHFVERWRPEIRLGRAEVGVAEKELGNAHVAGSAGDVITEGVAHGVRRHLAADAGCLSDPLHRIPDRLLGCRLA